jgi:hypothetical protein
MSIISVLLSLLIWLPINTCEALIMSTAKVITEKVWRTSAAAHQSRIRQILQDGLTPFPHAINSGKERHANIQHTWTALDPKNPTFNFLVEYYGLKGVKGPRRLARWSPPLFDTGGVFLQGATEQDIGDLLHLRGAILKPDGILYNPATFFHRYDTSTDYTIDQASKAATPFLWYRSILQTTATHEPIFHCYNLHEWAMQYWPQDAPPPPSAKYQGHLPLRVSRETINQTVQRKGVSCTHVDALRFFAPAAGPYNKHGCTLQREDQLRLEQPACVHATMDLLKISLRLQPFVCASVVAATLELAVRARRLDVAASPYDASAYGIVPIPVETAQGRLEYKTKQRELMKESERERKRLLKEYELFLKIAFEPEALEASTPLQERYSQASPGSLPWRLNLIETTTGGG